MRSAAPAHSPLRRHRPCQAARRSKLSLSSFRLYDQRCGWCRERVRVAPASDDGTKGRRRPGTAGGAPIPPSGRGIFDSRQTPSWASLASSPTHSRGGRRRARLRRASFCPARVSLPAVSPAGTCSRSGPRVLPAHSALVKKATIGSRRWRFETEATPWPYGSRPVRSPGDRVAGTPQARSARWLGSGRLALRGEPLGLVAQWRAVSPWRAGAACAEHPLRAAARAVHGAIGGSRPRRLA